MERNHDELHSNRHRRRQRPSRAAGDCRLHRHQHAKILFATAVLILPFLYMEAHVGFAFLGTEQTSRSLALELDQRLDIPFRLVERSSEIRNQSLHDNYKEQYWDPFDDPFDVVAQHNHNTARTSSMKPSPPPLSPLFSANHHRSNATAAVLVFGRGYQATDWMRFVGSLLETGYNGDIVLGIADNSLATTAKDNKLLYDFLEHTAKRNNVIVYTPDLHCLPKQQQAANGTIVNSTTQLGMKCITNDLYSRKDPRIYRHVSQIRYEYYWKWAQQYSSHHTNIMVSDVRDVYFQQNPFTHTLLQQPTSLQVFVEDARMKLMDELNNKIWIKKSRGSEILNEIVGQHPIVCSGITIGGKAAMTAYIKAMIQSFDETQCTMAGCDQGHHNHLLRSGRLNLWEHDVSRNGDDDTKLSQQPAAIQQIDYVARGDGVVNTLGLYCKLEKERRPKRGLSPQANLTLPIHNNNNGDNVTAAIIIVSPVLHQFDRCDD